jgi:hypothetical protein
LGIDPEAPPQVGAFRPEQCAYLKTHRADVFR